MRILKINPIEVRSISKCCPNGYSKSILVGKCYNDQRIYSYITFPPFFLENYEVLNKAILRMYCKRACGTKKHITVNIDNDYIGVQVLNVGNYEWDVTSLIRPNIPDSSRLHAYTKDDIRGCGLKEFEALNVNTRPVLTLFIDELPRPDRHVTNIIKEYVSTDTRKHSDWIDCISMGKYYYFIQNQGNGSVEMCSEISPDKNLSVQDSGLVVIGAHETSYIQPIRESRFVRVSFRNLNVNMSNPIKVWLQGM